jgi:ribonuclease-3
MQKNSIPILPTPLPSKRFRKNPLKRATLFPIEQIPTFPLPPLPPIDDPVLLKQVFTHLSLFKSAKGKFEDAEDDQAKHYEKLEHVGDSLLGMIVTTWLHELKPGLTPGTATVSSIISGSSRSS